MIFATGAARLLPIPPPPCRGPSQGLTWCCEIPTLDLTRESPSIRGIRDLSVAPTRSSDSERTNYRLLARDGGGKPLPGALGSTFLGGGPNTLAKANIDLKEFAVLTEARRPTNKRTKGATNMPPKKTLFADPDAILLGIHHGSIAWAAELKEELDAAIRQGKTMSDLNEIERAQLCSSTIQCLNRVNGSLSSFPGLLKKIIVNRAWERRQVKQGGRIIELKSLSELITLKPVEGWGEDPKKVEAVIKDDPEVLAMYREAMKQQGERKDLSDNVTEVSGPTGNSKAYTLSRLKRQTPELFKAVCDGEMSANAAAIKAGFRKVDTPDEKALKALRKADNPTEVITEFTKEIEANDG